MEFTLKIMGSASAKPIVGRNQSAQALYVQGRLFLVDCGEGVQSQCMKYGVSLQKIDAICISHVHGDHVFGIFGLLSTMGMMGRTLPLYIYAPQNFGPILKFFLSYYGEGLAFAITHVPLKMHAPEVVYETKALELLSFPLNHGIDTYGFIFREKEPPLNVDKAAVEELGLTLTEIGALKRGEDVLRPAGRSDDATFMNGFVKCSGTDEPLLIEASEVTYRPFLPRAYAYCSDTAPFAELPEWVRGVDLLYHETTYTSEYVEDAAKRRHSTTLQAAQCALDAGVGKLIVGHFSSRCRDAARYQSECRTVFAESYAVEDGDVFEL